MYSDISNFENRKKLSLKNLRTPKGTQNEPAIAFQNINLSPEPEKKVEEEFMIDKEVVATAEMLDKSTEVDSSEFSDGDGVVYAPEIRLNKMTKRDASKKGSARKLSKFAKEGQFDGKLQHRNSVFIPSDSKNDEEKEKDTDPNQEDSKNMQFDLINFDSYFDEDESKTHSTNQLVEGVNRTNTTKKSSKNITIPLPFNFHKGKEVKKIMALAEVKMPDVLL